VSLYKVIFLGLTVAGPEEEVRLIKGLQMKFNLTPEKAESLLQRVPIVVKKSVSKEEMERYVEVFKEMGGRVRIEEESVVEPLEIFQRPAPDPEPKKGLYSGKRITCPQCGFEQPEADKCIKCGISISKYFQYQEMARSYEGKVREISSGGEYTPWEDGEGFIRSFLKTTQQALFSPTRFFKKVATGEGYWAPLIYGMISGIIGFGGTILWQWFFFSKWLPVRRFLDLPSNLYVIITVALPMMAAFSLLIESGVAHFCLTMVDGNKKGFEATFRAISYSFCGYLFGILPILGSPIGGIYKLILTIIGVREGHDISTGKAVLAIFLPVIVGIGLTILLAILIPLFFGMMGFSRGVKV
jgi:hypothetical protein